MDGWLAGKSISSHADDDTLGIAAGPSGNRRTSGNIQESMTAHARAWRMVVVGVLGGVGGAVFSFLYQLIKQIPCDDLVTRGPSCPVFTLSVSALVVGVVLGIAIGIYIDRTFRRKSSTRRTN